uniref:Ovule protein n=1 Tax=Loa loa TaxID=7209 RepID=A0A1I7VJX0_LOALO
MLEVTTVSSNRVSDGDVEGYIHKTREAEKVELQNSRGMLESLIRGTHCSLELMQLLKGHMVVGGAQTKGESVKTIKNETIAEDGDM